MGKEKPSPHPTQRNRSGPVLAPARGVFGTGGDIILNERQKRFADFYLQSANAADAARRAGYHEKYGRDLKKLPEVKAYLDKRLADLDAARMASADEVLGYLTRVMRGEEGGGGQASMKAAELLGKRLGLFAEKAEELPAPVIIDDIGKAVSQGG